MANRKIKVAINGFGRIGRSFFRASINNENLEVMAVNDLGDLANLAYLLKYDTAYGIWQEEVKTDEKHLIVNGRPVVFLQEKDPRALPWRDLAIDVVVESTGIFETYAEAKAHLEAGARKVVVSAPIKDKPLPGISGATVLMGINEAKLATCQISSNASCTTNSASPLIKILNDTIGIEKAILNTVHGYTATQKLVDSPDAKDWRRGRAGAQNIVPSTTGAAIAVTEALPELVGKFDGIAMRVPVITGSLVDVTFIAKRSTTATEINKILTEASLLPNWQRIFKVTEEQLVSTDIIGESHASIADLSFTKVVGGNLVKVLAWYDNEMGYVHTLIKHVIETGK